LVIEQPDLTLEEIVAAMAKAKIAGSRTPVWRFYERDAVEQKRAEVARARRRWIREQGMLDPARLVFIDETCTSTAMVRLRGRSPRGKRLVGYSPHGHRKTMTFVAGLISRSRLASPSWPAPASNARAACSSSCFFHA
jgi:hypothetical protein